jgi:hypothetical protein
METTTSAITALEETITEKERQIERWAVNHLHLRQL